MPKYKNANKDIIGAWKLVSYTVKTDSGEEIDIWGKETTGMIIYLKNGNMSVYLSNKNRPKFKGNDFLAGSLEEIRNAFEGCTAYIGRYEYRPDEQKVLHHITESLFPNWSGITQTRYVSLGRRKLSIKTPPIDVNRRECVMELHWERIDN